MRWLPASTCECARSGACCILWSQTRATFDALVDMKVPGHEGDGQSLHMRYFRELLLLLHPEGLSEDDIDSGEVALHSASHTITWVQFEKWHSSRFKMNRA